MSNKPVVKSTLIVLCIFSVFGAVFLTGCIPFLEKNSYPAVEFPPESLQQIEPLTLEEAEEEEIARVEMDAPAPAPAELELSLSECRALTLENNLDLKVQLINPTIAAESVSQEEAQFEATFGADITYNKTKSQSAYSLDIQGNETEYMNSTFSVKLPLRTGGEINVGLRDYTEESNSEYLEGQYYSSRFSASISQPLLRNAGRRVNEYSIRIAELNKQITDTQTKLEAIRIIAAVDKAYWRLYAHRRLLDVRRQQYELAKALFEETESYVEVGAKPRIELMRTRASVAEKLEAIINAENDVRDTERDLKRMLNKPDLGMNTETILIPTNEPDPVRYGIQREQMVANAIENRMEMLQLELQLAQDASKIDYRRNQKLPLAALEYTYNMSGLDYDERGDAYDSLFNDGYDGHNVNLQVSIPLGNKAAKSQLRQALYERSQRLADKESQKAAITYEVLQQIDKLEANWQRIMATRQTTILDDELYRAEKRQFELGMVTSTDVLDAQTTLADAQRAEISAIADYQISLVDLAVATGTLLGAAKVELAPVVP